MKEPIAMKFNTLDFVAIYIKIMTLKLYRLFLLLITLTSHSCATVVDDKSYEFRGKITTHFDKLIFERNFKDSLGEKSEVNFPEYDYGYVQVINDSTVSLLDYRRSYISFLDFDLKTISNLILPNAESIMMYNYVDSDTMWLYNFKTRSLQLHGNLINSEDDTPRFPTSYLLPENSNGVYRVSHLSGKKFMAAYPIDNEKEDDVIFRTLELDSDTLKVIDSIRLSEILPLSKSQKNISTVYDGEFVSDNYSNTLVFKFRFTSGFILFEKSNGKYKYVKNTIDSLPPPAAEFVEISPGAKRLELTPNILYFPSSTIDNNYLYVLNYISNDSDAIIDVYNLALKGSYEKSIYIPTINNGKKVISIDILNNTLFALYENQKLFKMKLYEL